MVYATAWRQTGDADLAEEVTQAVFILLAQKAPRLSGGVVVAGWLYRTACLTARRVHRDQIRRRIKDREAAEMNLTDAHDETWNRLQPHLDAALTKLAEADRTAVVLRFLEQRNFHEVAATLGGSEEAAKKRVARALQKLRLLFNRQGVTLSLGAMTIALSTKATKAAPADLLRSTVQAGFSSGRIASVGVKTLVAGMVRDAALLRLKWNAGLAATGLAAWMIGISGWWTSPHVSPPVTQATPPGISRNAAATSSLQQRFQRQDRSTTATANARILVLHVIADESGLPLADVAVHVELSGWSTITTDDGGTARIAVPSDSAFGMNCWVTAPGRVPTTITWNSKESLASLPPDYILRLPEGRLIAGKVVDETGQPVAGAAVHVQGEGMPWDRRDYADYEGPMTLPESDRPAPAITDANGRWSADFFSRQATMVYGYVQHADFATTQFGHVHPPDPISPSTNLVLVLQRGGAVAGIVKDAAGNPIPNAMVSFWDRLFPLARRGMTTDAAGHFEFSRVEDGEMLLGVEAKGLETVNNMSVRGGQTNIEITLNPTVESKPAGTEAVIAVKPQPKILLHGTVTDQSTGHRLPEFTVLWAQGYEKGYVVNTQVLTEGRNGKFAINMLPAWVCHYSSPGSSTRVDFRAPGYVNKVVLLPAGTSDINLDVALKPAVDIAGRVFCPDGSPAAKATVFFHGEHFRFNVMNDFCVATGQYPFPVETNTGADGTFRLPMIDQIDRLEVAHSAGWASVPLDAASTAVIHLQPWGSITGVVRSSSGVRPGFEVRAREAHGDTEQMPFRLSATSDANGQFNLPAVPGGWALLSTSQAQNAPEQQVQVEAGRTANVTLSVPAN
jgi:RNA polymerase sigma factor (sigma-70 family)